MQPNYGLDVLFGARESYVEFTPDILGDLRFTVDEAASLLNTLRGVEFPLEHVNALHLRTEGWAVGLKMAGLSLGRQEDAGRFIAAFTGTQRYLMDYLIEEVLEARIAPWGATRSISRKKLCNRVSAE